METFKVNCHTFRNKINHEYKYISSRWQNDFKISKIVIYWFDDLIIDISTFIIWNSTSGRRSSYIFVLNYRCPKLSS